jgi:putative tryptophan/tyrosine transport system substrate-binding protein
VVATATALAAVKPRAGSVPIVFVIVSDPVGNGFVNSLADPGPGITGFSLFEYPVVGKWLDLLKSIVTPPSEAFVMMHTRNPNWSKWLEAADIAASKLGLKWRKAGVENDNEINQAFRDAAKNSGSGIITLPDPFLSSRKSAILNFAAELRVPVVYPARHWCDEGGLICYGIDVFDLSRRAASYVHKILQGTPAGSLPVQRPTKFEMAINLKTAKALGLTIPHLVLALADELIEQ